MPRQPREFGALTVIIQFAVNLRRRWSQARSRLETFATCENGNGKLVSREILPEMVGDHLLHFANDCERVSQFVGPRVHFSFWPSKINCGVVQDN